ncbi:hypothetical protein [Reyranella sp.]|uniref:hypothetical protein n=1 Tax=Reyranella sp. TaxID=1929291 RepID=UPI003C7DD6ED
MGLWDKAWPGGSIRLGLALGAAPLDGAARVPLEFMPLEVLGHALLQSANFDAIAGGYYAGDTRGGSIIAKLDASPTEGDEVWFDDHAGTWGTYPLLIDPNGSEFEDAGDGSNPAEPMACDGSARFCLKFTDGKWRPR